MRKILAAGLVMGGMLAGAPGGAFGWEQPIQGHETGGYNPFTPAQNG